MSEQKFLYNDDPYKKEHEARIIGKSIEFGLKIDELIFADDFLFRHEISTVLHDISVRRATCVSQRFTAGSVRDRTENVEYYVLTTNLPPPRNYFE